MRRIFSAFFTVLLLMLANNTAFAQVSALKNHDVKETVDISADSLEVKQKDNIAVFQNNVLVTQKDMKLTADRITVFYEDGEKGEKSSHISRMDASGTVVLTSPTEEIHSSWGIYDLAQKIITLGGNVTLKGGDGVIKGKRLQLNLQTGIISIEGSGNGRVSGKFTPPS